MTEVQLL